MAHKQVDVTWKESSRPFEDFPDQAPDHDTERVSFDRQMPDSSSWIQDILKEAKCSDMEGRLSALWRFNKLLSELLKAHGLGTGAECISYFLQRDLLKELQADLIQARVSGDWFLVFRTEGRIFFINRVVTYVSALEIMMVDERTTRYILREFDDLLELLDELFQQAAHDSLFRQQFEIYSEYSESMDARRAILRAVSTLVQYSNKAKRRMTRRGAFFSSMIQGATTLPLESPAAYSGLKLIVELYKSYNLSEQKAVLEDILILVSKCLNESSSLLIIHTAVRALFETKEQEELFPRLQSINGVPESFIAIAACKACDTYERILAIFLATGTSRAARSLYPRALEHMLTNEKKLELFERLADSHPSIKRRVETLAATRESSIPIVREFPCQSRNCFGPACGKAEEKPETFKMCRGCLLAIYCSAGEWRSRLEEVLWLSRD